MTFKYLLITHIYDTQNKNKSQDKKLIL